MNTALVVMEPADLDALEYSRAIANAAGKSCVVVCLGSDTRTRMDTVDRPSDDLPELVNHTIETLDAAPETNPEIIDCRGPNTRRALIDLCIERAFDQLVIPIDAKQINAGRHNIKRRIARSAPFNVIAIDSHGASLPKRVLVPQLGGGGSDAVIFAARHLLSEGTEILAIPDPDAMSRSTRVLTKARERVREDRRSSITQTKADGPIRDTLEGLLADDDIVLISLDGADQLRRAREMLLALRDAKPECRFTVAFLRDAHAASPGRFERWFERARMHAPTLNRDERRDLYEMLDRGGKLSVEFAVMMMLSTAIASLGLIQSSTAVVIGAMLVAPLMTPLVAIGMALVQGNARLFQQAGRAMLTGIVGALLVSMGIALLSPWGELSSEILARGGPNVFDLAIALLSGVAAAFALARPGLAGTLVGVAIAVALVPPLASIGIATIKGHFDVALGAGVLFTTNLFAIVVGAAMVFRFFGLDASLKGSRAPEWARVVLLLIAIGLLPITGTLVHNLVGQIHQGVHRPYARPLPQSLRQAILERVARQPGVEVMMMMQSEIETDFGIEIVLLCQDEVSPALRDELIDLVRATYGTDIVVRVLGLRGAEVVSP